MNLINFSSDSKSESEENKPNNILLYGIIILIIGIAIYFLTLPNVRDTKKPVQSTNSTQLTQPVQPTQPTKPAQSTQPTIPNNTKEYFGGSTSSGSNTPPVTDGLVGYYDAANYTSTTSGTTTTRTIPNSASPPSGKLANATCSGGAITDTNKTSGFITGVAGTVASGQPSAGQIANASMIRFDTLPSNYTIIHLAKYNNTTGRARIFEGVRTTTTGTAVNWLSGFHAAKSGIAHPGTWKTQSFQTNIYPADRWVLSVDQNSSSTSVTNDLGYTSMYRANGIDYTTNPSLLYNVPTTITINDNSERGSNETSDWAFSFLLVYNRMLTIQDIKQIESWAFTKYSNLLRNDELFSRDLLNLFNTQRADALMYTSTDTPTLTNAIAVVDQTKFPNGSLSLNMGTPVLDLGSGSKIAKYVRLPSIVTLNRGLSFGVWFRSDSSGNFARIFDIGNGAGVDNILLYINGGHMVFSCRNASGEVRSDNIITFINNSTFYHITITMSQPDFQRKCGLNVYLNGELKYATPANYPEMIERTSNYIGKSNFSADPYFKGAMNDFFMYQKPLTPDEVKSIYTSSSNIKTNDPSLYIYYPMTINSVAGTGVLKNYRNIDFATDYIVEKNYKYTTGNKEGQSTTFTTLDNCRSTCNSDNTCVGFEFVNRATTGQNCFIKTSLNNNDISYVTNTDTYIKFNQDTVQGEYNVLDEQAYIKKIIDEQNRLTEEARLSGLKVQQEKDLQLKIEYISQLESDLKNSQNQLVSSKTSLNSTTTLLESAKTALNKCTVESENKKCDSSGSSMNMVMMIGIAVLMLCSGVSSGYAAFSKKGGSSGQGYMGPQMMGPQGMGSYP